MRLKKLKMVAFGPYKDEQVVDFSKFLDDSLFLITGETGSGKTTIFDAICFVLYGDVSGQRKEAKTLKSDFSDIKKTCYVELEFEVNNETYFIKRTPEQLIKKAKGDGLKQQKHIAELTLPDGKIITNLKEISNMLVDEILGVDKENFNKLLMLPQGRFQKLLTEKGEEQVNTFRKIFGTTIYEQIANRLFEEKQNLKREYDLKVYQNDKKINDCFFKIEDGKDLNFSDKFKIAQDKNERMKKELEEIGEEIKKKDLKLKEIEVSINNVKIYFEKEKEKKDLKQKKDDLTLKISSKEEFNKKKEILNNIENLKAYYIFWQEKETQKKQKENVLNNLEKDQKNQQDKMQKILEEFKNVEIFENKLSIVLDKQNKFNVILNNFELLQNIKTKINLLNKEVLNLEKDKEQLEKKIKLKELYLKIEEKKELNEEIKIFVKEKKEQDLLEKEIENLKQKYLNGCKDFYEQNAYLLAKQLKKGEKCPVCGSIDHPNPKVRVSSSVVDKNVLQNLRETILKMEKKLNSVLVQIKTINRSLEQKKLNFEKEEILNFLKSSLKEQFELENSFKIQKKGLNLNLDEKYEEELLNLNMLVEKKNANIFELKKQMKEFLEKIPKELHEEVALKKYETKLLNLKKELEKKINTITKQKEDEEKVLSNIDFKLENLKVSFLELEKEEQEKKADFFNRLKETKNSFDEFKEYYDSFHLIKKYVEDFEKILKEVEEINIKIKTIEKDLASFKVLNLEELEEKKKEITLNLDELKTKEKALIEDVAVKKNCLKEIELNLEDIKKLEEDYKVAKILSEVAKGSKKRVSFEKYVLTACLNEVLVFANEWFKKATANRYFFYNLDFQDCLNFNVFDTYSGKIRHVSTLSGGETFAASLALCLGLCGRVCSLKGGIQLDTMLIDEGFGTLDSSYLDSVVSCLVNLKKAGRQIGIISHIPELKNRIKSQIIIKKSKEGGSKVLLKW